MNTVFQVITLAWSLQGGQYFKDSVVLNGIEETRSPYFVVTSFELSLPFSWKKGDKNGFFIGSTTETKFFKNPDQIGFDPWQDTFTINSGIKLVGFEFGIEHQCVHPLIVSGHADRSYFFSGYDKVYCKISGTF